MTKHHQNESDVAKSLTQLATAIYLCSNKEVSFSFQGPKDVLEHLAKDLLSFDIIFSESKSDMSDLIKNFQYTVDIETEHFDRLVKMFWYRERKLNTVENEDTLTIFRTRDDLRVTYKKNGRPITATMYEMMMDAVNTAKELKIHHINKTSPTDTINLINNSSTMFSDKKVDKQIRLIGGKFDIFKTKYSLKM